jgi:hypothetical protein
MGGDEAMIYVREGSISFIEYSGSRLEVVIDGCHLEWNTTHYTLEQIRDTAKQFFRNVGHIT